MKPTVFITVLVVLLVVFIVGVVFLAVGRENECNWHEIGYPGEEDVSDVIEISHLFSSVDLWTLPWKLSRFLVVMFIRFLLLLLLNSCSEF